MKKSEEISQEAIHAAHELCLNPHTTLSSAQRYIQDAIDIAVARVVGEFPPRTQDALHTPGPWYLDDGVVFSKAGGFIPDTEEICRVAEFGDIDEPDDHWRGMQREAAANAELICAAPALQERVSKLEALAKNVASGYDCVIEAAALLKEGK